MRLQKSFASAQGLSVYVADLRDSHASRSAKLCVIDSLTNDKAVPWEDTIIFSRPLPTIQRE